ncbi:MAG TPA: cupin domain-containing protein [Candidatus Binatia bacterium]|jgi:hypothetical protein|nr:cupin domain-containing protein [Candidatus Binatia bacterium]
MRRKLTWLILFTAVIAVTALYYAETGWATPSIGYKTRTLGKGGLGAFSVFNHFTGPNGQNWASWEATTAPSDLYVQDSVWLPGGTTGWHSHPGHSLIIVTEGTVTDYEGDDPNCTPHVYTKGMAFMDAGGSHVHIVRNEGTVEASTIAVQLIPQGQPRRIDAPDPGNCRF